MCRWRFRWRIVATSWRWGARCCRDLPANSPTIRRSKNRIWDFEVVVLDRSSEAMMKISSRRCVQVLCGLGILVLNASAWGAEEPVKLGAAVSMTGSLAKLGAETKAGYELWMEKVNAQGGLTVGGKKRPVSLTFYDDQSDANRATKLVDKLISEDGIKLILGPYSSGFFLTVSTITERNHVLLISAGGNADELFTRNFRYIFGVWPLASEPIQTTLKVIKDADPSLKSVGIAVKDNLFSLTAAKGARNEAKDLGYNIV